MVHTPLIDIGVICLGRCHGHAVAKVSGHRDKHIALSGWLLDKIMGSVGHWRLSLRTMHGLCIWCELVIDLH